MSIEQLENGYWTWDVQLDAAPEYFEVGVSADEVAARIDARNALQGLAERRGQMHKLEMSRRCPNCLGLYEHGPNCPMRRRSR